MMKLNIDINTLHKVVEDAYSKYKDLDKGHNASYIPYLKNIDSELFGISVSLTDGSVVAIGDTSFQFGIESISKVSTALLVLEQYGASAVIDKIGSNATGMDFDSLSAILLEKDCPSTPLVNAGAIVACSMVQPIGDVAGKWEAIQNHISALCGSETAVLPDLYKNESDTNFHNRSIAWLLKSYNKTYDDPDLSLDLYTRQCSVGVTVKQLSLMAGTIANKGLNPVTRQRVFNPSHAAQIISMMATVGMYNETGDWMFRSGTPAKSGVGGGIIAICPDVMGIAVFSPPLNSFGNSVKGKEVIQFIASELGLSIFE